MHTQAAKLNHKLCSISQSPGFKSDILHGNYPAHRRQPSASTHICCSQCDKHRTQQVQLYHTLPIYTSVWEILFCKFLVNGLIFFTNFRFLFGSNPLYAQFTNIIYVMYSKSTNESTDKHLADYLISVQPAVVNIAVFRIEIHIELVIEHIRNQICRKGTARKLSENNLQGLVCCFDVAKENKHANRDDKHGICAVIVEVT